MESGDRQTPEVKIKVEHKHPVQVGEEGVVEGGISSWDCRTRQCTGPLLCGRTSWRKIEATSGTK